MRGSERDLFAQVSRAYGLSAPARQELEAWFKGTHGEYVLYVDRSDLLVRAESRYVTGTHSLTPTTVTYSRGGEPVTIVVRPASDVVNGSTLGDQGERITSDRDLAAPRGVP